MTDKTQFEQENDLGGGGGEVDEKTMKEAWREAERRLGTGHQDEDQDGDAAA